MVKERKLSNINAYYILASFSIIFLPFWRLGNLVITLILSLLFFKFLFFEKKHIKVLVFLPFILFISLLFLYKSVMFTNIKYLDKIWLLGLVPLGFAFFSQKRKKNLKIIFSISIFFAQIYSLIHVIYYFFKLDNEFEGLTDFNYINSAIGFERPYVGFMSSIAILFLLFTKPVKKSHIIIKSFLIIFNICYIIFISSKLAMILALLFLVSNFFIVNEWKLVIGLVTTFIIVISTVNLSISERFSQIKNDDRIYLWKNTVELIDEDFNVFFGKPKKGFKETQLLLTERNINNTNNDELKRYYSKRHKNVHNQFLSLYLSGGIIAVILFLIPFMYFSYCEIRSKNISNVLLIIALLLFLTVENLLERQTGVILLATFFGLLITFSNKNVKRED